MEHTKGPWKVNAISINKRPQIIGDASITSGVDFYTINNHNATIAKVYRSIDARLIAAAPELLKALKEITIFVDDTPIGQAEEGQTLVNEAIKAIAKAERE